MKVLHINYSEKYGGAAKAANRLHLELLNQGINSKMLVLKKESTDPTVIEVSSLYSSTDRLRLLFRKILNRMNRKFLNPVYNYNNKTLLFNALRKLDFDILHLHWVTDGYVNLNEFKNSNWNIVWTMHDCAAFTGICHVIGSCYNFETNCGKCPLINSTVKKDMSNQEYLRKIKLYKKTGIHFVSPSKWLALTASKSPLLKDKLVTIIPHGLDIEKYSPINKTTAKRALEIKDDSKIILCGAVTLDDKNKGMHLFSKAILFFKENYFTGEKIEIMFFGDSVKGWGNSILKTTYLGYISDELLLRICYSAADVVVVPSRQESFGLIALEAMACGTPVVAFGATGLLDIIDNKVNGYLATPYESVDLATGIKWCLDNNKNFSLSESARAKAISDFNIKLITHKYLEFYNKILTDK